VLSTYHGVGLSTETAARQLSVEVLTILYDRVLNFLLLTHCLTLYFSSLTLRLIIYHVSRAWTRETW